MGKSFKTFDLFKLSSPVKSSRSPARLQILITMVSTALSLAAFLLLANVAQAFVVPDAASELKEREAKAKEKMDAVMIRAVLNMIRNRGMDEVEAEAVDAQKREYIDGCQRTPACNACVKRKCTNMNRDSYFVCKNACGTKYLPGMSGNVFSNVFSKCLFGNVFSKTRLACTYMSVTD